MPKIAVFGGTGYLASLIKNQNNVKKNEYIFFSRKKTSKNYINYSSLNDEIEIKNTATNREGFAKGAILAAEWIIGKTGVFNMNDIIK